MIRTLLRLLLIPLALWGAGCGYRFAAPPVLALAPVGNSTEEAGLGPLLAEAFRAEGAGGGGWQARGPLPLLQAAASSLRETPLGLTADALPVRQELTLEVEWRLLPASSPASDPLGSGKETVSRSYAWDPDPVICDRRRSAALVLLSRSAARAILLRAGRRP